MHTILNNNKTNECMINFKYSKIALFGFIISTLSPTTLEKINELKHEADKQQIIKLSNEILDELQQHFENGTVEETIEPLDFETSKNIYGKLSTALYSIGPVFYTHSYEGVRPENLTKYLERTKTLVKWVNYWHPTKRQY